MNFIFLPNISFGAFLLFVAISISLDIWVVSPSLLYKLIPVIYPIITPSFSISLFIISLIFGPTLPNLESLGL